MFNNETLENLRSENVYGCVPTVKCCRVSEEIWRKVSGAGKTFIGNMVGGKPAVIQAQQEAAQGYIVWWIYSLVAI